MPQEQLLPLPPSWATWPWALFSACLLAAGPSVPLRATPGHCATFKPGKDLRAGVRRYLVIFPLLPTLMVAPRLGV